MNPAGDAGQETRSELLASRARILADADESRRRWQSEIHDGAQQRLVHALVALKLARASLEAGSPVAGLVDEALTNLERASSDLRDAVQRVLPRSLTFGGLRAGLASLVADRDLPVELRVDVPRLPAPVETTAYAAVASTLDAVLALDDVRDVQVVAELAGAVLVVAVRHDGPGPDAGAADGLLGVRDRVAAAGGSVATTRTPGGTVVRVTLPTGPGPPRPGDREGAA